MMSNNNTALFTSQPAVSSNGTLTYTPAATANGSAIVTLSLQDDGGISNGGVNTSASQTCAAAMWTASMPRKLLASRASTAN